MAVKIFVKVGVVAAATTFATIFSQTTANAEVVSEPTEQSVVELQSNLESQGYAPTATDTGGVLTKKYSITTPDTPRVVIETTEPVPTPPGTITPYFNVGFGNGIYVYLNRAEQQTVTTGGANALGVAICAVPGVGQVACGATLGALNTAATYLNANGGYCPGDLEINYLDFPDPRPNFKCV